MIIIQNSLVNNLQLLNVHYENTLQQFLVTGVKKQDFVAIRVEQNVSVVIEDKARLSHFELLNQILSLFIVNIYLFH